MSTPFTVPVEISGLETDRGKLVIFWLPLGNTGVSFGVVRSREIGRAYADAYPEYLPDYVREAGE